MLRLFALALSSSILLSTSSLAAPFQFPYYPEDTAWSSLPAPREAYCMVPNSYFQTASTLDLLLTALTYPMRTKYVAGDTCAIGISLIESDFDGIAKLRSRTDRTSVVVNYYINSISTQTILAANPGQSLRGIESTSLRIILSLISEDSIFPPSILAHQTLRKNLAEKVTLDLGALANNEGWPDVKEPLARILAKILLTRSNSDHALIRKASPSLSTSQLQRMASWDTYTADEFQLIPLLINY